MFTQICVSKYIYIDRAADVYARQKTNCGTAAARAGILSVKYLQAKK